MAEETINHLYWLYYLEGRRAKLLKGDVDAEELAQDLVDNRNKTLHEVIAAAAAKVALTIDGSKSRRKWLADHEDDFGGAGAIDKDEAYRAFCRGRADELAYSLEIEVVEALEGLVDPEGDDDDVDEDVDEDEDEDEDGDDD